MEEKLLSVIMPTFNSVKYIDRTMNSLFLMIGNYSKLVEVIIVDDGSSDGTQVRLKQLAKKYDYIKVITNKHCGVSSARNLGMASATSKYVTFLDSDDTFESNFVETFQQLTLNHNEPDLIFVDVKQLKTPHLMIELNKEEKLKVMQSTLNLGEVKTKQGIASKFFKLSFLLDNNLRYDNRIVISEDALFNLECISKANSALLAPNPFYHVEESHTLMYYSPQNLNGQLAFLAELKNLLKDYKGESLASTILNQSKLKATNLIVDRYYGPLYINGTNSLMRSAQLLEKTIKENDFDSALKTNQFDDILSIRYRIFRRLLKCHQYRLCLLFDKYLDKIKGYNRFRP